MRAPVHIPPASARLAQVQLEQSNRRIEQAITALVEAQRQNEQVLRMIRVAPAKLRPGDEATGCALLPAWNSTIGSALARVADLRKVHPSTALAKFLQGFDADFDNETDASQALGTILGRLAASCADFAGYTVRVHDKQDNANRWEVRPLNIDERPSTAP